MKRSGLCCWFLFCGPRQTAHRYGFRLHLFDSSDFTDGLDVGGGTLVFGGGGLNLLLLGLALTPVLAAGGFLVGVLISGASESSESAKLLSESDPDPDSLPSLSLLSLFESSSSLLLSLLLLSPSEATSANSLRYRSELRISRSWYGLSSAVLIG